MLERDVMDEDGVSAPHFKINDNYTNIPTNSISMANNITYDNTLYTQHNNNPGHRSYDEIAPSTFSTSSLQHALATISQSQSSLLSTNEFAPPTSTTGIVDSGCTTMIIPRSVADSYKLPLSLLPNPFSMHYAEKGSSNMITHGVLRDKTFVWNFIAVSDRVDIILIDIKQAVRAGYTLVADEIAATLLHSKPPYTAVLTGPVNPNGSYEWDFAQVLNLRNPRPEWFESTRVPTLLSAWLPTPSDILTTAGGVVKGAQISEKRLVQGME